MKGRPATVALLLALAALAAAAAVEALWGDGAEPSHPSPSRTRTSSEPETARALAAAGIEGVLYYVEPDSCRLRALRLPEIRTARAPESANCTMTVSPDGRRAADGGAVWRADGLLFAVALGGGVEVVSSAGDWSHRFEGARAPAFKPNGALTLVRRGRLVAWVTSCSRGEPTVVFREAQPTRRCARVLWTEAALTAAAAGVPRPPGTRLALESVAWLSDDHFAALVGAGRDTALVVVGRRRVVGPWTVRPDLTSLVVSPRRRYISLRWGGDLLIFTRRGIAVEAPEGIRAFAWSPDDRWLAVAHEDSLGFYAVPQPVARAPFIAISTRDVDWRSRERP